MVPTVALEGFGLITVESLSAGTPVLVTPVGGLPEAVAGLSQDLVLPSTGANAIADGIDGALSGRHPTLLMPRDFDLSPFFEIVKVGAPEVLDYERVGWEDEIESA